MIRMHPANKARAEGFAQLNLADAKRIMLIGIGTGADLPFVTQVPLVVGVDLSCSMLKRAGSKAAAANESLVSIIADATNLPFSGSSFDAVVMTLFVSVVPNPEVCIQQASRVLKDGGRMLVLDKFLPDDHQASLSRRMLNLITRPFGTDINRHWKDMAPPSLTTLFDKTSGPGDSIRTIVLGKDGSS